MKTLFEIEPAYAASLRAAGLDNFDAIFKLQGGPPASKHRHRETIPVEVPIDGQPRKFFLKRVFWVPPKHSFWPLFRGKPNISQPRNEWNVLAQLYAANIPAMRRAAYGEQRHFGRPIRAFILVEAVPMLLTLEDWLSNGSPLDTRSRDRLICEVGSLVGSLHARGFSWPDMHAKHIFAEREGLYWSLRIIDAERMRTGISVNTRRFLSEHPDLWRLRESLIPTPQWRHNLLRFAAGYLREVSPSKSRPRKALSWSMQASDWDLLAGPLPRWHEDLVAFSSQRFERIPGGFADSRFMAPLQSLGLASLDDVFKFQPSKTLSKPGLMQHRDRASFRMTNAQCQERTFYLKRYRRPPLFERMRHIIEYDRRHSAAWRERHFIKRLNQLGICTPQITAFGEEMQGILERRSFLITEEVPGQSLEKCVEQLASQCSEFTFRHRAGLINELAKVVRLMHKRKLFHRDLYLSHVFLGQDSRQWPILTIIDLARMIEKPLRPLRWRIKDLAALDYSSPAPWVTRADRIRFLKKYFLFPHGMTRSDRQWAVRRKRWLRYHVQRIGERAQRIAQHDARRKGKHATD